MIAFVTGTLPPVLIEGKGQVHQSARRDQERASRQGCVTLDVGAWMVSI